jgi:hypothetical protein
VLTWQGNLAHVINLATKEFVFTSDLLHLRTYGVSLSPDWLALIVFRYNSSPFFVLISSRYFVVGSDDNKVISLILEL